jgi:type VI secretion system secreted protein VgrG
MFTRSPRALTVHSPALPVVAGVVALVPLKLEGVESINALFEYTLTLQTPDALMFKGKMGSDFELSEMVGRELTCKVELEGMGRFVAGQRGDSGQPNRGAGVREISGVITDARYVGEDDRHALYQLTLRPWLHLATLTRDCKVFQNQTPVQVIESVLADYPFASDKRLIETYPARDYCVQYNESDFEFITRLMQEWGINYHFEHSGGVHRLIWSDHNGAFQVPSQGAAAYKEVPYYPLGHKIDQEYIHALATTDRVRSGSYASREYDYTRPKADLATGHAAPRGTGQNSQEVYAWHGQQGSDYSQPNAGNSKEANQTEEQGRHLARLRMQALRQGGLRASGQGHIRGIVPGCTFSVREHPKAAANVEYITLRTRFCIENVGEDTQRNITGNGNNSPTGKAFTAMTDTQRLSGQWQVHTAFELQATTEALRPELTQPKPQAHGPESALVCGPGADTAESNIYTDPLGRIKVQFPWDRYGPKNQNSSCWVRVSSTWAGNQLGAMHIPRIGQEVVVDFLGGDPDCPIVTGSVYNAMNMPPWSLPDQQALSGFRSRELMPGGGNSAAGRSNHLILDDTEAKIQAQLKSDHAHSQLSLGHITRITKTEGRQDDRGEGFELRTDAHGAIRAQDGLLISTEARTAAQAHITDMGETTSRLTQARDQHEKLGDLAQQHQAQDEQDQAVVSQAIKAQNAAIQGKASTGAGTGAGAGAGTDSAQSVPFPELQAPHLVLASPAGIQSTTAGSTHQHSQAHHAITAGQHISQSSLGSILSSAAKHIRAFANLGVRLFAGKGKIEIQAQDNDVEIKARQVIDFIARQVINVHSDKRVRLQVGPHRIEITPGGGIELFSPQALQAHTGNVMFQAAKAAVPVVMPKMPISSEVKDFSTLLNLAENSAFNFAASKADVYVETGESVTPLGTALLKHSQKTQTIHTDTAQTLVAFVGDGGWEMNDHEHGDGGDACCDLGANTDSKEAS